MGVVYEAEQISLQRRVALKVLPFAVAIDARRLQRFKNEALAAAHLKGRRKRVPCSNGMSRKLRTVYATVRPRLV